MVGQGAWVLSWQPLDLGCNLQPSCHPSHDFSKHRLCARHRLPGTRTVHHHPRTACSSALWARKITLERGVSHLIVFLEVSRMGEGDAGAGSLAWELSGARGMF